MKRWNSLAIPRERLKWALTQRSIINKARQEDSCLLCCASNVNEAGLCEICWALLDEEELKTALTWLQGNGP